MNRSRSGIRALFALTATLLALFLARPCFAGPIRLWHAYRGDEQKALEAIVARWNGTPVELLALPYDAFATKLASAIPLGDGPDLFIDAHERLGDYRARHLVAPVGDALDAESVFAPPSLRAVKDAAGIVWGLPIGQKSLALFMNEELAREPPQDLESIAEAHFQNGVYALVYEAQNPYAHAPLLAAFGGRLLDDHDGFGFVGEAASRSLDFARDLVRRGAVPEDADGALVTSLFRSGRAAFAVSGPWLVGDLGGSPALRYRVLPLPRLRATGAPMAPLLTVESVLLAPRGAERADVRAFARHLASLESATTRALVARTLPARRDAVLPEGDHVLAAFAAQAEVATPTPSSRAMRAVWEPAARAMRKVLRGDASPDAALREAERRFDDVRRPPPGERSPVPLVAVVGALCLVGAFRALRRARAEPFGPVIRRSLPAYAYVAHAVVAVGVLVVAPLVVGALTSLFAGASGEARYVGLANFAAILTARGGPLLASGSFYLVLLVTVLWTVVNVTLHLAIGLGLGLLLARPLLKLRALYRVLLIVPWAVPSYVTALAWKGMFHRQFGAVSALISALNRAFGLELAPIAWFSSFGTAFTANVATNVWLGFPFMMVVTIGALTSVPDEVLEAAEIDGAGRFEKLRLVVLPMIRPALLPAVTLGAIWTFNMFNVVFLVSGGDPDGTTDILVSEAYRWAFTREAQYGYAAAYAVLIFLLLSGLTRIGTPRSEKPREPSSAPSMEAA